MQAAIAELKMLITHHFPSAQFTVQQAADEPEAILLVTTVDIDDPDDVTDLVIERMMELQIDQGLPIFVVPVRHPARVMQLLNAGLLARLAG